MVKRQRDKQYQSAREHRTNSQIRASGRTTAGGTVQRRLPFGHCSLSLTKFESPVCNREGIVFDNASLLQFLMQHKVDPVSGAPMTSRDVITLHMDKDEQGRWQCPILTKPFSDHTKIVAVLQPGGSEANVYSYEAYHELNVKAKNYEDLISGVKFNKKKDVLILNDPNDDDFNQRRDINKFYHITNARALEQKNTGGTSDVRHSLTATRIMDKLKKNKEKAAAGKAKSKEETQSVAAQDADNVSVTTLFVDGKRVHILATDVTGVKLTSGQAASSFSSTAEDLVHENVERDATLEEVLQSQFRLMRKLKKKGRIRMRTNLGELLFELHCDIAPRTCTNFLGLARAGKYDGVSFHRLIKSFMIQGGKAKEGEDEDTSIWGAAFVDEFDDRLKHSGPGILSMANAGANTNKRQFFISFKSCGHLDRKHSVFGKLVGGMDVLKKLEQIETDKKDRPQVKVVIEGMDVLEDPAEEARNMEEQRITKLVRARLGVKGSSTETNSRQSMAAKESSTMTTKKPAIGRYLAERLKAASAPTTEKSSEADTELEDAKPSRLPPPPKKTKFGDFSGW